MKKQNIKLQRRIISFIILGMLVGFSAFLYINYLFMYKTTTLEIHEKLTNRSANLANSIQEWLDDKQRIADALANGAKKIKNRTPENVRTYLNIVRKSANIDACMIYYKGHNLIHTQLDWQQTPKQEEQNMPYQTMLKNGFKPTISRVFKSPINKKDNMIAAISPFENDSIATLVVEIKDVEDKVKKAKLEGGYSVLLDVDKKILFHPDEKLKSRSISESFPELKWLEDEIFSKKSGLVEYEIEGQKLIMLFDTIKTTNWKMLIVLKKDLAFARLNTRIKNILLVSLVFFVIGTIFIILINMLHEYWRRKIEMKKDEYEFMLIRRSKMSQMGELVSGINHQLHQPLNSLNLLSTSMLSRFKNDTLTPKMIEENLKMSQKVIRMMGETIDTFKNFYKPNENITTFSLKKSIENVLQIVHVDFSKKNINVDIFFKHSDDFTIVSVKNFIQQVLLVLLQNAKDALLGLEDKSHKNIKINIHETKSLIYMEVEDWGEGIGEKMQTKLFKSVKSSKKNFGSGLGLYFARKIAQEKLGGDLSLLKASNPTTFRFSFKKSIKGDEYATSNP